MGIVVFLFVFDNYYLTKTNEYQPKIFLQVGDILVPVLGSIATAG